MRVAILLCIVSLSLVDASEDVYTNIDNSSVYHIDPRTFKDSDGNGVGDIRGIISELDNIAKLNVEVFVIYSIYPSSLNDNETDILDFTTIDPCYGTMQDFDELINAAHQRSLKVVMELVPNHSSDKHDWFQKSLQNIAPYSDYYIWHKGRVLKDGTVAPPNNWVSVNGGPAWTWREERKAYYFHQFAPHQPDLNYGNQLVVDDVNNIVRFWLKKGVDGLDVHDVPLVYEDQQFLDEPLTGSTNDPNDYKYTQKKYTKDQGRTCDIVRGWGRVLREFKEPKYLMVDARADASMNYSECGVRYGSKQSDNERYDDERMSSKLDVASSQAKPTEPATKSSSTETRTEDPSRRSRASTLMTIMRTGVGVVHNSDEIDIEHSYDSKEEVQVRTADYISENRYENSKEDNSKSKEIIRVRSDSKTRNTVSRSIGMKTEDSKEDNSNSAEIIYVSKDLEASVTVASPIQTTTENIKEDNSNSTEIIYVSKDLEATVTVASPIQTTTENIIVDALNSTQIIYVISDLEASVTVDSLIQTTTENVKEDNSNSTEIIYVSKDLEASVTVDSLIQTTTENIIVNISNSTEVIHNWRDSNASENNINMYTTGQKFGITT